MNPKYTKIYLGHYIDHFFLIVNLKGFIGCGLRSDTKSRRSFYICESCFSTFWDEQTLKNHIERCRNAPPIYKLPKEDSVSFVNYKHTLPYHAVCYADFEATTLKDSVQIPNSFCIFCPDFEILEVRYSPSPDELFKEFWSILEDIHSRLLARYKEHDLIDKKQEFYVDLEGSCKFCGKKNVTLVKHHDHFNGKFLDYACVQCNNQMRKPNVIRVFFHNLKGYDSHFIVKYGIKQYTEDQVEPLGKSSEKLFSIKVGNFLFLDSYSHLPFSLSQLIKDYVKEKKFSKFLPDWYTHKEAYPYEWFDDYSKFELDFLPPRECFYSRLSNSGSIRERISGSSRDLQ
jgi:hypothetical protein